MHFEGEFRVPGKAEDVIRRFSDVPRMARCMPGAVLEPQAEDGSWPGAMVVSFGPKKINFKGKATCDFDYQALTGLVHGRGTADMRAARIGVKVAFALSDVPAAAGPETLVKIVSDAQLGGVLEDFARTGGIAVANVIMADFARRASEEFSKDTAPAMPEPAEAAGTPSASAPVIEAAPPPPAQQAAPLAAGTLFWVVVKAYWTRLLRSVGLVRS
jgi:carbon monoxide dehydrogenase subunit G